MSAQPHPSARTPRPMPRILLIDDDVDGAASLTRLLRDEGFWVDVEPEGTCTDNAGLIGSYELLIVDVMTRRFGGFNGLRRLRGRSAVPVLVLTTVGTETDRVAAFESGADDYVVKPCRPREIAARIRALWRRANTVQPSLRDRGVLTSGRLALWPAQRRVDWLGSPLRLTSTEFSVLELLLRKVGRPVSKAELSVHALGRAPGRYDRSIDTHVCSVRRKLGLCADGRSLIQTVHLRGYQLLTE